MTASMSLFQRCLVLTWPALLTLSFAGCAPEDPNPVAPTLTWIAINATEFQSASESVVVTLGYQDHQGDIGWEDPDRHALDIQDERLDAPDTYHIPPLTPDGIALDIAGTFEVTIPPLFLLGNGGDEQTRFTFRITDRAGHASNTVQSPVILITDTL
jgi:hypothetical protein